MRSGTAVGVDIRANNPGMAVVGAGRLAATRIYSRECDVCIEKLAQAMQSRPTEMPGDQWRHLLSFNAKRRACQHKSIEGSGQTWGPFMSLLMECAVLRVAYPIAQWP